MLSVGVVFVPIFNHLQVDALTTKRGKEGGWVVERLLNQVKQLLLSSGEENKNECLSLMLLF